MVVCAREWLSAVGSGCLRTRVVVCGGEWQSAVRFEGLRWEYLSALGVVVCGMVVCGRELLSAAGSGGLW